MVTDQRVLVVGATGYPGKFVVKDLKRHGYRVHGLRGAYVLDRLVLNSRSGMINFD